MFYENAKENRFDYIYLCYLVVRDALTLALTFTPWKPKVPDSISDRGVLTSDNLGLVSGTHSVPI